MIVSAENISHFIGGRAILEDVSVAVNEGDFITIIGPNGAGKSTLLKCLMGLMTPQRGRVHRKAEARIGYIPQKMSINPSLPMTVARFIDLNVNTRRTRGADADGSELENELGAELGIAALNDKPIHHLSGGEWQRVLLARTLRDMPDALVLDEPAQNLDMAGQVQFYKLLDKIHKTRGLAILMVSHDVHMVMASTQQVICLYHHICCSGAPQTIAQTPEFAQIFGQDMAAMMAVYQHQHDHDHSHDHNHG